MYFTHYRLDYFIVSFDFLGSLSQSLNLILKRVLLIEMFICHIDTSLKRQYLSVFSSSPKLTEMKKTKQYKRVFGIFWNAINVVQHSR